MRALPAAESPVQIVHRHVEAMNKRDIDGFMAELADGVSLISAAGQTLVHGRDAVRGVYAGVFNANPELKTELMDRINVGSWVFDEHLMSGFASGKPLHLVRVYQVVDGRIQSIKIFD